MSAGAAATISDKPKTGTSIAGAGPSSGATMARREGSVRAISATRSAASSSSARRPYSAGHRGRNPTARVEHEATTSEVGDDQMFYCQHRGLSHEDALSPIVIGFCKEVLKQLPVEFAAEAQELLAISLEGDVGRPWATAWRWKWDSRGSNS